MTKNTQEHIDGTVLDVKLISPDERCIQVIDHMRLFPIPFPSIDELIKYMDRIPEDILIGYLHHLIKTETIVFATDTLLELLRAIIAKKVINIPLSYTLDAFINYIENLILVRKGNCVN